MHRPPRAPQRTAWPARVVWLALALLSGCSALDPGPGGLGAELGYYWRSAAGHLHILGAARPVDDWLADPDTPAALRERLQAAQRIRVWASAELHLPDNASYRRYADLHRSAVVWNVVAAPPGSLRLRRWCFPVAGCVSYRGHHDEAHARAEAEALRAQGWEVSVQPVPAYSTLGWSNWVGGDPLLNTFIGYPDGALARLVFHELAHQVVYVAGDTEFNESFATAVERLGGARWVATQATPEAQAEDAAWQVRRDAFRALTRHTRERLLAIYDEAEASAEGAPPSDSAKDATVAPAPAANVKPNVKPNMKPNSPPVGIPPEKLALKMRAMDDFRAAWAQLRSQWGGDPARWRHLDRWVAEANNASFGAQGVYDTWVPAFEALFVRERRDWPRFYDAVKRLAALPQAERRQRLKEIAGV